MPKGKTEWQVRCQTPPPSVQLPDYSKHDGALAERPVKRQFNRGVRPKASKGGERQVPAIWHGKARRRTSRLSAAKVTDHRRLHRDRLPGGIRAEERGSWGWQSPASPP